MDDGVNDRVDYMEPAEVQDTIQRARVARAESRRLRQQAEEARRTAGRIAGVPDPESTVA